MRSFSVSWSPIYQIFILEPETLVFCSGSCLLWVEGYFTLSVLLDLVHWVIHWGLWYTWTWDFCRGINTDLFAIFSMCTWSYSSTICWRCFSPHCMFFFFCLPCQKSSIHSSVGLFQGLWFDSIDQPFCSNTNSMQFLITIAL